MAKDTRFVEHDTHVDIEENFGGIWAVTSCNMQKTKAVRKPLKAHQRYYIKHKEKINARHIKGRRENFPNKINSRSKYAKYGMTDEDYEIMFKRQKGKCNLCGRADKKLVVDHDHNNGNVRGLLCTNCNVGIGLLQDSPKLLNKAAEYIKKNY